ncbi:MAG: hypothetical protein M3440_12805 [Chloroflexota bacterium]|nr:hypothetical protein [Chloroflexota bacterium]
MSPDFLDRIEGIADIVGGLLTGGIWILLALFGFLASMRDKAKKRNQGGQPQPSSPSRPRPQAAPPSPYAPAPASGTGYGTLYSGADDTGTALARRRDVPEEARPTYGSHDKAVWGSVFDDPGEEPKWGFDESEWGSSFGPKKTSEPTISQG